MQNKSHAVMAQRSEPSDSTDYFPTPPWATRALCEYIIGDENLKNSSCLEPACGGGHMSEPLKEYFRTVRSSDAHDYGYGTIKEYLSSDYRAGEFDWVITNPPFKLAEEFVKKSLEIADYGVAMLVRTVFLESVGRYKRLFQPSPPSIFAQFVERVPMVKGRVDPKATTATGYAWIVWKKRNSNIPTISWVPPCRKLLERDHDYPEVINKQQLMNFRFVENNSDSESPKSSRNNGRN
jgi:hypothetical protein